MVGIIIVFHSAKLAAGVKELAQQMIQTDVRVAIAPAFIYQPTIPEIVAETADNPNTEWQKLQGAIAELTKSYQALEDPYLQARAWDVEDVGLRILRLLLGISHQSLDFPQGVILVAEDLTVSEMAQLKSGRVLGICTSGGSATSHSALIANQLGIPAIAIAVLELDSATAVREYISSVDKT